MAPNMLSAGAEDKVNDYAEYPVQDDDAATAISRATIATAHLQNLDDGITINRDYGEDDDMDESMDSTELPILMTPESSDSEDESTDDELDGSDSGDDDDETPFFAHVKIFTQDELLRHGLLFIGYTEARLDRAHRDTNIERFKAHFGVPPNVGCAIWEDLQVTQNPKAWVPPTKRNVDHFLMALHHLKRYPTELERECIFDISLSYGRQWVWYFCEKIQQLKTEKIVWPEFQEDDIWVCTVDGTHCWIQEPQHPTWSINTKFFSHKYARAGMNYELAISLTDSKLIWMNGPYRAGANDKKIFSKKGLQAKLKSIGKRAIGDSGYTGAPEDVSSPNAHDSTEVKRFKSRALKRHERFNGYTKAFDCLSGRFRHGTQRFQTCFEAVSVICQYQLENGFDLFDILLEDMAYEY